MRMGCLCTRTPKEFAVVITDAAGKQLAVFDKRCPEHGVVVQYTQQYRLKPVSRWFSRKEMAAQVVFLRKQMGLRLVDVAPDQSQGLLEWLEWEPVPGPAQATA
jgi:hypothetical protein